MASFNDSSSVVSEYSIKRGGSQMNQSGQFTQRGDGGNTTSNRLQLNTILEDEGNEKTNQVKRSKNDIKDLRSVRQLERLELSLDSPRLLQACKNLGISPRECIKKRREDFIYQGVKEEVIDLRFRHSQHRLIDTINRVLEERRQIRIASQSGTASGTLKRQSKSQMGFNSKSMLNLSEKLQKESPLKNNLKFHIPRSYLLQTLQDNGGEGSSARRQLEAIISLEFPQEPAKKEAKIMRIQKELQNEAEKDQLKREQDARIKRAVKMSKERLKTEREERREINLKRAEEVQKRMVELSKLHDEKMERLMTKQNSSMTLTLALQLQLEQERRKEIRQKEEEYQERMRQIQEWREYRDQQEQIDCDNQMQIIQEKLSKSQVIHKQHLSRISSEAKLKNDEVQVRMTAIKERKVLEEQQYIEEYKAHQKAVQKKLQYAYDEVSQLFQEMKAQRKQRSETNIKKKGEDFKEQQLRNEEIQARIQAAEIKWQEQKEEQQHDFMIRNEQRRLREEDIRQLKLRQQRLLNQKKQEIIEKGQDSSKYLQLIKDQEESIKKKKLAETIRHSKEALDLRQNLLEITAKGRPITPNTKRLMESKGIIWKKQGRKFGKNGLNSARGGQGSSSDDYFNHSMYGDDNGGRITSYSNYLRYHH